MQSERIPIQIQYNLDSTVFNSLICRHSVWDWQAITHSQRHEHRAKWVYEKRKSQQEDAATFISIGLSLPEREYYYSATTASAGACIAQAHSPSHLQIPPWVHMHLLSHLHTPPFSVHLHLLPHLHSPPSLLAPAAATQLHSPSHLHSPPSVHLHALSHLHTPPFSVHLHLLPHLQATPSLLVHEAHSPSPLVHEAHSPSLLVSEPSEHEQPSQAHALGPAVCSTATGVSSAHPAQKIANEAIKIKMLFFTVWVP